MDIGRFFRFNLRARRRTDGHWPRAPNWLVEKTAGYGGGVERAFASWAGRWFIAGSILLPNTDTGTTSRTAEWRRPAADAHGTSFANAHASVFLVMEEGILEESRALMENHDRGGLLAATGLTEAVLGPRFLLLLLLTLGNRCSLRLTLR